MANTHSLDAEVRTVIGKKVARLRRTGLLPATVYGKGISPISIQIDGRLFNNTFRQAGRTALIELNIPQQPTQSAFVHAIQRHPVSRQIIHVDFRVVNLREEITVEVPIALTGESPLVAREDAVLNQVLNSLHIRSLPGNLPQHIDVDISSLDDLTKSIFVRDISIGSDYAILNDPDDLVVTLSASRMASDDAEAVAAETEGDVEGAAPDAGDADTDEDES